MKSKILVTALLFFFSITLWAQVPNAKPGKYLLSKDITISGFGASFVEISKIQDDFAVFTGGGGGVLLGQTFYIGAYGSGLSTVHLYDKDLTSLVGTDRLRINFGHGGLWLGYLYHSTEKIHFGFSTKIGMGQINLHDDKYTRANTTSKIGTTRIGKDNVLVVIPQIEAEFNVTRWFKINVGAGYRHVNGLNKHYINSKEVPVKYYKYADYSYPEGSISLIFGWFDNRVIVRKQQQEVNKK